MALSTAQQVRLRISDTYRFGSELISGDGTASAFNLREGAPYSNLSATATASIFTAAAATGWSATAVDSWNNEMGRVVFADTPSAHSGIQIEYFWSVFSEDEIDHFTAVGGSVPGAALEAVNVLLFDSHKRARWAAPDGSNYDDSKATDNLMKIRDALRAELTSESGPQGGTVSWAEEQGNF